MTLPRSALISYADTPWYHLVNRYVRWAFLFLYGSDAQSGQSYEHRRRRLGIPPETSDTLIAECMGALSAGDTAPSEPALPAIDSWARL